MGSQVTGYSHIIDILRFMFHINTILKLSSDSGRNHVLTRMNKNEKFKSVLKISSYHTSRRTVDHLSTVYSITIITTRTQLFYNHFV